MLTTILILTLYNTLMIITAGIVYFKTHYEILPKDVYNVLAETYEKATADEESSQELAGGCGIPVGFNADYLQDDEEEDE